MKIEQEILKIYEEFNFLKKLIKETTDIYGNVDFKDRLNNSSSTPSKDNINPTLLSDIQTAAKMAGVKVDITTAITGHKSTDSRHPSGNAVDIAIIDGKPVSPAIKDIVNRFVNELVKLGYTKNSESNNPKAVLTFGFPGHDDHVHISNITGDKSSTPTNNTSTDAYKYATSNSSSSSNVSSKYADVGTLSSLEGLFEQNNFGRNTSNRYGKVIIPKDTNPKIKSPISGIVNNKKYFANCINQITIENNDNKKIYLQFCGISNPLVRDGQTINIGDTIGNTDSDVEVNMYDHKWDKRNIPEKDFKINKKEKEIPIDKVKKSTEPEYYDPLMAAILGAPARIFQDKYDEGGNRVEKRYGGVADKKQVDPWVLNFLKDPLKRKKVNENIEKIKKML